MEDEALDIYGLGGSNDDPANRQLIRADVGSNVINCPNALNRPLHNGLVKQITSDYIINAKRIYRGNLIMPVNQCSNSFSTCRKRLNNRPAGFTSRACDQNHGYQTVRRTMLNEIASSKNQSR